jgi:hypothetical protein
MIVWKITGNEIGPDGNGARFFANKRGRRECAARISRRQGG